MFNVQRSRGWKRVAGLSAAFGLLLTGAYQTMAAGTSLNLAWDPSPDAGVAKYSLYFGEVGTPITNRVDVGQATTGSISGLVAGKTYTIRATATSQAGVESQASNPVTYSVPLPNTMPQLGLIADQTVKEGVTLTLQLSATDSDLPAQTLTFGLVSGPAGAVVNSTGLFTWTPPVTGVASTQTVTVKVTDNGVPPATSNKSFLVSVTAPPQNTAPVLASVGGRTWETTPSNLDRPINGSFEAGFTNWTASGSVMLGEGDATDGLKAARFNSGDTTPNGRLTQDFNMVAGRQYTLKFDAGIIAYVQNEQKLRVSVQGATPLASKTISLWGTGSSATQWKADALTFVADAATGTIVFEDVSPSTAALDMLLDQVQLVGDVSSIPTFSAAGGTALSLPLTATDAQEQPNALAFTLVSGPAGASLSPSGLFTWTPPQSASASTNLVTVRVADQGQPPLTDTKSFAVEVPAVAPSTVSGAYVFYNNSRWDNNDGTANAADDNALATDKRPLSVGQVAKFENYTSYSRGLNGIMIDISRLPGTVSAADFRFLVGNKNTPTNWSSVAAPSVSVRQGAGVDGSDRVTLIWPDNVIQKTWLEVTVLATPKTGLSQAARFYFGNAIGEAGNSATDAIVDPADMLQAKANRRSLLNPAPVDFRFDYNRDKEVDPADQLIARANQTSPLSALRLIDLRTGSSAPLAAATAQASARTAGLASTPGASVSSTAHSPAQFLATATEGEHMRLTFRLAESNGPVRIRWTQDLGEKQWVEVPSDWVTFHSNGTCEIRVPLEFGSDRGFFRFDSAADSQAQH
jgi:hypothetical protein